MTYIECEEYTTKSKDLMQIDYYFPVDEEIMKWGVNDNGYQLLLWDDEHILELGSGKDYTTS